MWGTPIPVFYAKDTGIEIVNKDVIDHICGLLEADGNMDFWWKKTAAEIVPKHIWEKHNIDPENVVKGEVESISFENNSSVTFIYSKGYFRHLVRLWCFMDVCIESSTGR